MPEPKKRDCCAGAFCEFHEILLRLLLVAGFKFCKNSKITIIILMNKIKQISNKSTTGV